jgi:hypothetical protein
MPIESECNYFNPTIGQSQYGSLAAAIGPACCHCVLLCGILRIVGKQTSEAEFRS